MTPATGSADTGARGSQEPAAQLITEPVDVLRIPIEAYNTYSSTLEEWLDSVDGVLGPRGESAGHGAITTELWRCTDNAHRFKVTFRVPEADTMRAHDATTFDSNASGTTALWSMQNITGAVSYTHLTLPTKRIV